MLSQVTSGATRRRPGRPVSVAGSAAASARWCRPPSRRSGSGSEAHVELSAYAREERGWSGSVDSRAQDGV
ncbi:hypothetical protein [Plantactinospora sp. DSM 117369]